MAFLIDEAYLPATLTVPPMTDQQFADFCAEYPDLFFEMTAEGELLIMPPNFSLAGFRNSAMVSQLDRWQSPMAEALRGNPQAVSYSPTVPAVRQTPLGFPKYR